MAGLEPLGETIQMISADSKFNSSGAQGFIQKLTKKNSNDSTHYSVISIIGAQSGGKSYLLNKLFGTKFAVLPYGRRCQTTTGIWVAGCIEPRMLIMDIEGFDSKERGEDEQFEKRTALFALAISDVLMLNMSFGDIGREKAGKLDLIEFIFKRLLTMEVPLKKTEVIVLIRDHDYNQSSPDTTEKDVLKTINKLWGKACSDSTNRNMSLKRSDQYIVVTVIDFPNYNQKEEFAQKTQNLAKQLCNFAQITNREPKSDNFAKNSELIWKIICEDKWIIATKDMPELAAKVCMSTKEDILKNWKNENSKGYEYLRSSNFISVKEFNAELSSFLTKFVYRYEVETITFKAFRVWEEQKVILEKTIVDEFQETFEWSVNSFLDRPLSLAKSNLYGQLDQIANLKGGNKASAVTEVIQDYINIFDTETRADLNTNFEAVLSKHREELMKCLVHVARDRADKIQKKRGIIKGLKITGAVFLGAGGVVVGAATGTLGLMAIAATHSVAASLAGAAVGGGVVGGITTARAINATKDILDDKQDKKKGT